MLNTTASTCCIFYELKKGVKKSMKFLHTNLSTKQRLLNAIGAHPKLVAFGIGLAITMSIGATIGMFDVHSAAAYIGIAGHSTQQRCNC